MSSDRVVIGEDAGMFGCSEVGKREKDEDFVCGFRMETVHGWTCRAAVLCDGMGGGERGEDASRIAAKTFLDGLREALGPKPSGGLLARAARLTGGSGSMGASAFIDEITRTQLWRALVGACHEEVRALAEGHKVGTTLTAVVFRQDGSGIGWCDMVHIGDSRCYALGSTPSETALLTDDHSLTGEMVEGGYIELHEIPDTHGHNVLLRSIGMDERPDADITSIDVDVGARFLICCDGVWGPLHEESGMWLPDDSLDPQSMAELWVTEALERGSTDNCSALLLVI